MTLVHGNKGLAEIIGVTHNTISRWKNMGLLNRAIVVERHNVIRYDLDKALECLNGRRILARKEVRS